jgi:serine/threonine-protein kinase
MPTPDTSAVLSVPSYTVGERLGEGGFGEVFRARHAVIGREVAIKVLHAKYSKDSEAVARFVAEARAVNQISHPGIVEIFDFGELPDGRAYCVMELIHGKTLRDVLRERTRLPLADALPILRGIAEAIDAAHAAGIAHRDLKPDNVFVTNDGVKVIDFGLAKLTHENSAPITETGAVFGTPLYMSPEQCRGKAVTGATDAYSFGVLAYHVLVGEPPFSGEALDLALHHLNDQPAPPSERAEGLNARVDRVVLALMAKDPAQRPVSLVDAIAAIAGDAALPAKPRTPLRWRWLAAGAAALALAGGATIYARGCVAPGDDCVAPETRLAGVWDGPARQAAQARFAAARRADVDASFRVLAGILDDYTHEWSRQWVDACHAPDRKTDPLLYAQRTTCLENALIAMQGFTDSVAAAEVVPFSEGFNGEPWFPALADCEAIPVLRAQPPAPPPAIRAQVDRLVGQVHRARADARAALNAGRVERVANALAMLRETAKQLDALGAPAAVEAWFWLSSYLLTQSRFDRSLLPEAEQAVASTIKRAIDTRNDPGLPFAYLAEVQLGRARGDTAKVDAAFERWAVANERAGQPKRAVLEYWRRQAEVDLDRGRLDAAGADIAKLAAAAPAVSRSAMWTADELRSVLDEKSGHFSEAVKDRHAILDQTIATWGPEHPMTRAARRTLANVLALAGDAKAARDELRAVLAADESAGQPPRELASVWSELLVRSLELGDTTAADDAIAHVDKLDPDGTWPNAVVDQAMVQGRVEAVSYVLAHADVALARAAPNDRGQIEESRAYLAFMLGDYDAITGPATRAMELHKQVGTPSNGEAFLAVAEVRRGHVAEALAHVPFHVTAPPELNEQQRAGVRAGESLDAGFVQHEARQWKQAAQSTRAAVDTLRGAKVHDWNLAEAEAFLGDSLERAGEPQGAIEPLEDSLEITKDCCAGFHYFAPMAEFALARALVATSGDKARAHHLAEAARDHYARIGPHRDDEREAVIRWLAEH